jgi:hypothetical protein
MFGAKIIGAAKRVARKRGRNKAYPLCAFTLTIGGETDGKEPVFTKVGTGKNTSNITKPVWRDDPKELVKEQLLGRLYVGNESLGLYQDWHSEADEWVHSWDAERLAARASRKVGAAAPANAVPGDEGGVPGDQDVPF